MRVFHADSGAIRARQVRALHAGRTEINVFDRLKTDRGMTIIETTVVLAVLFVLAGAMSPIVGDSVTTARAIKAKNDARMIAVAMVNFQKDLGDGVLPT